MYIGSFDENSPFGYTSVFWGLTKPLRYKYCPLMNFQDFFSQTMPLKVVLWFYLLMCFYLFISSWIHGGMAWGRCVLIVILCDIFTAGLRYLRGIRVTWSVCRTPRCVIKIISSSLDLSNSTTVVLQNNFSSLNKSYIFTSCFYQCENKKRSTSRHLLHALS